MWGSVQPVRGEVRNGSAPPSLNCRGTGKQNHLPKWAARSWMKNWVDRVAGLYKSKNQHFRLNLGCSVVAWRGMAARSGLMSDRRWPDACSMAVSCSAENRTGERYWAGLK